MSKTVAEIVDRMRGKKKFLHMIYVGREYTIADAIRDFEEYDRQMQQRLADATKARE